MNIQSQLNGEENGNDASETVSGSRDGFNGLCDINNCGFFISCRADFDEVKRACDDHNSKNPGHFAAPVNCTL